MTRGARLPWLLERAFDRKGGDLCLLEDRDPRRILLTVSRPQLRSATEAAARVLAGNGVGEGTPLVLCLPTGLDFVRYFLAASWLGAVPIPLPVPTRGRGGEREVERVLGVVRDSEARWVVGDDAVALALAGARTEMIDPGASRTGPTPPATARPPSAVAFIQYTAGSTAHPKGVVITGRNLRSNLEAMARAIRVQSRDRVLSWLPLFHDMGLVGGLLFPLAHRLPLFLYSPLGFALRPGGWLQAISRHRATLSAGPHFAFSLCAHQLDPQRLGPLDLSCWRLALDGAEPLHAANVRAFLERFGPVGFRPQAYAGVYGMSEATVGISFPRLGAGPHFDRVGRKALSRGRAHPPGEGEPAVEVVSLGVPLPGLKLSICEVGGERILEERRVGEVVVRGDSISPRYLGQPGPARTRLRTGDLGYLADGELYLVGRLKEVIIHGGANLYPADVEQAAAGVEGLRKGRVVAFGVPSAEEGTEQLVVAAELGPGQEPRTVAAELRLAVLEHCGVSPAHVLLLGRQALPLTTSGKLMRARARQSFLEGTLGSAGKTKAGSP